MTKTQEVITPYLLYACRKKIVCQIITQKKDIHFWFCYQGGYFGWCSYVKKRKKKKVL